jgi:predicted N-formylglutamate amidohydrolase
MGRSKGRNGMAARLQTRATFRYSAGMKVTASPASTQPDRPPHSALLGPGDPPAYEAVNPEGRAPFLLICDHASRKFPSVLGSLGLDASVLERHIAWDIGAADVARHLSRRFDAPLVLAGYSRLVIDLNRTLDDPTSIAQESDGVEIPGNRKLDPAARAERAQALFHPYHGAIEARLDAFSAQGRVPAVISIHSFTPTMNGFARPWHIGVLWDRDPRIAEPLLEALKREPGAVIGDNEPYSAREPNGYSADHHAARCGYPHIEIEIRQDLIDSSERAAVWAERIARAFGPILAAPELYRIERYERSAGI